MRLPFTSVLIFLAAFATACDEGQLHSDGNQGESIVDINTDGPAPKITHDELASLLAAIEQAALSNSRAQPSIYIQIMLGENGDVRPIWATVTPGECTDERLIAEILRTPEEWQIVRPGQPIVVDDVTSVIAWQNRRPD